MVESLGLVIGADGIRITAVKVVALGEVVLREGIVRMVGASALRASAS